MIYFSWLWSPDALFPSQLENLASKRQVSLFLIWDNMPKTEILFRLNAQWTGKCTKNGIYYIPNFKLECKGLFINLISLTETRVEVKNSKEKCPTTLSFNIQRAKTYRIAKKMANIKIKLSCLCLHLLDFDQVSA